jgi:hypothetical protein
MQTNFYRTDAPLSDEHRAYFTACHQEHFPGNQLAVMSNVAGDQCLVKCCGDMDMPAGFTLYEVLTLEQARALLATPEWQHPLPGV